MLLKKSPILFEFSAIYSFELTVPVVAHCDTLCLVEGKAKYRLCAVVRMDGRAKIHVYSKQGLKIPLANIGRSNGRGDLVVDEVVDAMIIRMKGIGVFVSLDTTCYFILDFMRV